MQIGGGGGGLFYDFRGLFLAFRGLICPEPPWIFFTDVYVHHMTRFDAFQTKVWNASYDAHKPPLWIRA